MAEPTSSLGLWDIIEEVGDFMGFGYDPTDEEMLVTLRIIESGYRQFLYPPLLPGEKQVHRWTFFAPTATITFVADDEDYDLPENYGGLVQQFTYAVALATPEIELIPEARMRQLRTAADLEGDPYYATIRPKAHVAATGTRYEVLFYPRPDTARTITYRYNVVPDKLAKPRVSGSATIGSSSDLTDSSANFTTSAVVAGDKVILYRCTASTPDTYVVSTKDSTTQLTLTTDPLAGSGSYQVIPATVYPLGGAPFNECLLESCMAVAEQRRNDAPGVHSQRFAGLVTTAIVWDRANGAPDTLGLNLDTSDYFWPPRNLFSGTWQYNSTELSS